MLNDKPRVRLLCHVTLIAGPDGYSPRLKFWKQNRSKSGRVNDVEQVADVEEMHSVKAMVDTADGHDNLWRLLDFLRSFKDIALPESTFSVVDAQRAQLASLLQSEDRPTVIEAIREALGSSLTEDDIAMMANRKQQLERFRQLLFEPGHLEPEKRLRNCGTEKVWQKFFEQNQWIFGYGLKLVSLAAVDDRRLEQITTGANLFRGGGKRADAVMRSRGFISSLLFCEIKKHDTALIDREAYRPPDVFSPSHELAGSIAQVRKTTRKALRILSSQIERYTERDGSATNIEFGTSRPRQVVVIGSLEQLRNEYGANGEQVESFELFLTSVLDTEILTFDELYQRARFIVRD